MPEINRPRVSSRWVQSCQEREVCSGFCRFAFSYSGPISAIEKIEITLRCRLSNYFCVTYGVLGYQDPQNFSSSVFHRSFMQEAQNEINRNRRAPFIKNFRENYEDRAIYFYALVEIFSFGTLFKFFKNLKNPDKKAIASTYQVAFPYFESWIESISYVRNICAHYGRLYNTKLTKKPMLYKEDQIVGISNERIFGVLCCMKHLLAEDTSWKEFLSNIDSLFQKHNSIYKVQMPKVTPMSADTPFASIWRKAV